MAITRESFLETAKPIALKIGDYPITADVKQFSTGSLGWYGNSKIVLPVGDESVRVQIGLTITVIGSKTLPGKGGAV